jgi:arylsulfatase A-like enzyme
MPDDFYGFEDVSLTVNHSDICSGHYHQWLVERGVDPAALQGPAHALKQFEGWWQVYQPALAEDLYPSHYIAERSIEFLERAGEDDRPFFLQCSFPDPHHPFTPPGRYYDLYEPGEMELPETFHDPHTHSMPFYRKRLEHRGSQRAHVQPFAPTEDQLRHALAAEYGMITLIDDCVGRVLAALERSGRADETVVVFTSDHGDMFGDHGMMLKAGMHYEGCTRVPLLIARPGAEPRRTQSLASSIDLPHTVLGLAGVPGFHGMQGHDLTPLLDDPSASVRDEVLVEEDEIFDLARLGCPLRMRTLITGDARLTLYSGSEAGELFDLKADPLELDNLHGRSAAGLQAELVERLARRLMETDDRAPKPQTLA